MSIKLVFFPFALVVLIWSFISYTKPAWDEYRSEKKELKILLEKKQELSQGIMNIKKALVEYQSLDEDIKAYVYNAIPMDGDNDNLIAEINKNASQSGVLITKIDAKKGQMAIDPRCKRANVDKETIDCSPKAVATNISLVMVGSYPMIKDFLSKLDIQNRIVVVDSMKLSTPKNKSAGQEGDTQGEGVTIKLVTAKVDFEVFQKEEDKKKLLSKIMDTDKVLKSLLTGGLNKQAIESVNQFITSQVFRPVQVEGAGKSNLFEESK